MRELLAQVHQRGIRLQLDGTELRVMAKPGEIDERLRAALRLHKAEILELLRAGALQEDEAQISHDEQGRFEPFPLTPLQHAYWLGRDASLEMGSVATHLYVELSCDDLDVARAEAALGRLIVQHDMLRAVVDAEGHQRVLREVPPYRIQRMDVCGLSCEAAEEAVVAVRDALSHQVLQADRWPLFEVRATHMPDGSTRLHVSLDLLILDAWSIFLFFREWHRLYEQPQAEDAPGIGFRDYVMAERARRDGARYVAAQAYWTHRVAQLPPAPDLPLRADPAARQAPRFSRRELRMDRDRWARVKEQARDVGLTPSALVLAAYSEVLARWSGSAHFSLSVTTGTRYPCHPQVHRLLGDFTSVVLHEVDRQPGLSFADFALAQQKRLSQDVEHSSYSGVDVRREWARQRGIGMNAAMPVVFSSGLVWSGQEEVGNLEQFGRKVFSISQTSQVWLDHHVMELGGELVLIWDAVDAVFQPGVLDAMFNAYAALIQRLADEPGHWLQALAVPLPAPMAERRVKVNQTQVPVAQQALHAGIVTQALSRPGALAVIAADREMSYGELLAEACALANALMRCELVSGEPVALVTRKGWEQVVGVLGVLLAGGSYVPVDMDLPVRRRQELLRLGQVRQVVAQTAGLDGLAGDGLAWQVHVLQPGCGAAYGAGHAASLAGSLRRVAYTIFTSGTTGVPKGVMIDHLGAVNTCLAINRMFEVGVHDRVLGVSSLSFDLSVYDLFGVLGAGATLVLPAAGAGHDPLHWLDLMQRHRVTVWNSAPQLMRMLLDAGSAAVPGLQPLRVVLLSGDFIALDLPERLREQGCMAQLISLGGATEASIWSIFHAIGEMDPRWQSIPYGRALPNQTVWVLDAALQPTPDHVRGRIYIGGCGLAIGYLGDEAKTGQRFITHPRTGERLYDTGDIGRYDERGDIFILGRDDGQVKIRGHRVELGEVESAVAQHPGVAQCVVLARQGSAHARHLVAYVVPKDAMPIPEADELCHFMAQRLPDYMVPRKVVALAQLPLSANGKIHHAALPDSTQDDWGQPLRIAPRTEDEQAVFDVWQRVMPGLEIGVTDNFFELGGDSVLATQLLREVNSLQGLQLEMHELLENLTIESLATLLARRGARSGHSSTLLAQPQQLLDDVHAAGVLLEHLPEPPHAMVTGGKQVFLTGATGWVGAHALADLLRTTDARVTCLVRAENAAAARVRLLQALQAYGLQMDSSHGDRVVAIAGDLRQPRLGLSNATWHVLARDMGCVVHLAASVGVLQGYALHRPHNVLALHGLLELAASVVTKSIVFLSPMAVCRRHFGGALHVQADECIHEAPQGLVTGYAQSKWVGEQILWDAARRGIPVRIYRCSHALPPASGAAGKANDSYTTVLQLGRLVDAIPDWPQAQLHGLPVDRLCQWMLEDALGHRRESAIVHLEQMNPPALRAVLLELVRDRTGKVVPEVPISVWQQRCLQMVGNLPIAQQALARSLFETRAEHMAVEFMFGGQAVAPGYLASRLSQERLTNLTPMRYWVRAMAGACPQEENAA